MLTKRDKNLILGIAKSVEDFKKEIKKEITNLNLRIDKELSKQNSISIPLKADYNIVFNLGGKGFVPKDSIAMELQEVFDIICPVLKRNGVDDGIITFKRN